MVPAFESGNMQDAMVGPRTPTFVEAGSSDSQEKSGQAGV